MNITRFKAMTVVGIILLAFYFLTANYKPATDAALEARCRAEMTRRGGEALTMIDRCKEQSFAVVMTARDATAAAHGASSANQTEILMHMASMFALGLGGVLTVFGLLGWFGIVKPRVRQS